MAEPEQAPPSPTCMARYRGFGGVHTTPDNPRGERSMSIENRARGKGEWNTYDVVAVDGRIKLSVNGKFVNGITRSTQKEGLFLPGIGRRRNSISATCAFWSCHPA